MKTYKLSFSRQAIKDLKQITPKDADRIITWLEANIDGCEEPRAHGKNLVGVANGWRYKVGKYRILTHIYDDEIVIDVFRIGKRGDVYKK